MFHTTWALEQKIRSVYSFTRRRGNYRMLATVSKLTPQMLADCYTAVAEHKTIGAVQRDTENVPATVRRALDAMQVATQDLEITIGIAILSPRISSAPSPLPQGPGNPQAPRPGMEDQSSMSFRCFSFNGISRSRTFWLQTAIADCCVMRALRTQHASAPVPFSPPQTFRSTDMPHFS